MQTTAARWIARLLFLVLFVVGVSGAGASRAGAAPVAIDVREVEARRDFMEGRYREAIRLFAALYAQSADPIHLRNIARCYQKLRQPEEAITNFRDYLDKAIISEDERREINSYIAEMETLRRKNAGADRDQGKSGAATSVPAAAAENAEAAGTGASPAATTADASTTVTVEPAPGLSARDRAEDRAEDRARFKTAGIVVGATGATLLAAGAAFGLAAYIAAGKTSHEFDKDLDRNGRRYESLEIVGFATGAVALLAGAALYWYGSGTPDREHATRVTAALAPWPTGLLVEARF